MLRVDFILSYWFLFWYFLFILNIVSYNPKFGLILGLINNLFHLIEKIIFNPLRDVFTFSIIIILIKIIPIYTIYKYSITYKDVIMTFCLIILYLLWIYLNNKSINEISKQLRQNNGPLYKIINNQIII